MKNEFAFLRPALRASALRGFVHEHLIIRDGRVTAFNGVFAASMPFAVDLECNPRADTFLAAHDKAGDAIGYDLSGDVLTIRSKGLRVAVPCLPDRPYQPLPSGDTYEAPSGFLDPLRAALPFVGSDDARPWNKGVYCANGFLTATNNVTVLQQWTGHKLPPINIPDVLVTEMIGNRQEPESVTIDEGSVTFNFDGERWLKCLLYEGEWPIAQVNKLLSETPRSALTPIPPGLSDAIARLQPFCKDKDFAKLYFRDGGIGTDPEEQRGAFVEFEGLRAGLTFALKALAVVAPVAHSIDWNHRHKRHVFYSEEDTTRGAVMGIG